MHASRTWTQKIKAKTKQNKQKQTKTLFTRTVVKVHLGVWLALARLSACGGSQENNKLRGVRGVGGGEKVYVWVFPRLVYLPTGSLMVMYIHWGGASTDESWSHCSGAQSPGLRVWRRLWQDRHQAFPGHGKVSCYIAHIHTAKVPVTLTRLRPRLTLTVFCLQNLVLWSDDV